MLFHDGCKMSIGFQFGAVWRVATRAILLWRGYRASMITHRTALVGDEAGEAEFVSAGFHQLPLLSFIKRHVTYRTDVRSMSLHV